jgi:hypothetical protein
LGTVLRLVQVGREELHRDVPNRSDEAREETEL